MQVPTLSVIIPVGPDEESWQELIDQLPLDRSSIEIIISASSRPPKGLDADIVWLSGKPGRGRQLNRAAEQARGQWLWFVHTDCRLSGNTVSSVLAFTGRDELALGYCKLQFLQDGPWLVWLNAVGANLRSRLLHLPYGDQALCLPARWLERLGGFREDLDRGEDLDLVVRARRAGLPIRPMHATVCTSARRYRDYGWIHTTWAHQLAAWRLVRNARNQPRAGHT